MSVRRIGAPAALVVVAVLAVAACGSGSVTPTQTFSASGPVVTPAPTPAPTPTAAAPSEVAAKIIDNAFDPKEITVPVGTTITWTNTGSRPHTVTADDGSFKPTGLMTPGSTFSHTFDAAGTFTFKCIVHPVMHGTVIVGP